MSARRDQVFELTGCVVDLAMRVVRWPGEERSLSPTEARLLRYLVEHAGETVERDRLLEEVWGYRPGVVSATVKTTMGRLRSKIEIDPAQPHHIRTDSGGGYLFVGELSDVPPAPAELASSGAEASAKGRGNLGHYAPERIGRDEELDRLRSLLSEAGGRLVTVSGPGGVGKTALVRWTAEELRESYDEVWLCDLQGSSSEDALVEALFETVGLASPPDASLAAEVLGPALEQRGRVLLILDHLEAVEEAAAGLCNRLMRPETALQVLAVSRSPLRLSTEFVLRLGPMDAGNAASLFRQRAGPEALEEYADDEAITGVLDRLDGLPHALEMASAWAALLRPAELDEQLADQLQMLTDDRSERPARHDSLRASVALSWSLIDERGRDVLAQCAVFSGAFDVEAAGAVLALDAEGEAADWRLGVRDLVTRSLLVREEPGEGGSGTVRVRMLQGVRALVRRLRPSPGACLRHAEYFARWGAAETHLQLRRGRDRAQLDRLLAEEDEVLKAGGYAIEQGRPDLGVACLRTIYFLRTTPWLGGVLRELSDGIVRSETATDSERCEALLLGACAGRGRATAVQLLGQAVELARTAGRTDLEAEGQRRLTFLLRTSDLAAGLQAGRRSVELAEACGDRLTLSRCSNTLARATLISGDHVAARSLLETAISLARDVDDAHTLGTCLHHLALLHIERDRPGVAIFLLEEAIDVLRSRTARQTLSLYLVARGTALARLERFDEALSVYEEAMGEALRHGAAQDRAFVLYERADVHRQQGRLAEARSEFEDCLAVFTQVGPRACVIQATGMLGELALERGNLPLADQLLDQSVRMAVEASNSLLEGVFEGARGMLWAIRDEAERARVSLARGGELLEQGSDRHEYRRFLQRWAEAEALLGDPDQAEALYAQVLEEEQLFSQADVPAPSLSDSEIQNLQDWIAED